MATNAPNLDDFYNEAGYKYNVDPLRLKAHAVAETNEKADVPSADGRSYGFGQFTPETWRRVMPGVPLSARRDPQTAIEAMAKLVAQNDDAHRDGNGNVDLLASTAAYNGSGPAAAAYARRVQAIYGQLDAAGGFHPSAAAGGKGQGGAAKPAANDDDAFGQTLKASPAPAAPDKAAPDKAANDDAFGQTLKSGPAQTDAAVPAKPVYGPELGETLYGPGGFAQAVPSNPLASRQPDVPANAAAPQSGLFPHPPSLSTFVGDVSAAVRDSYSGDNPLVGKDMMPIIASHPWLSNPLAVGGALLQTPGALFRGGQAAVLDLLGGGQLARDIVALPEALPAASADVVPRTGPGPRNILAPERGAVAPTPEPPPIPPEAAAKMVPETPRGSSMPAGEAQPAPQSGGAAATPSGQSEMSMAEYKANRKQGELNAIMEPNAPGPDTRTYVEGSVPTRAEHSNEPAISQQETLLRERDPDVYTKPGSGRLWLNNEARVRQFEEDMGSAPAREAINQDLKELAQREQPLVLRNAKPLDLSGVKQVADSIVNDPRQSEVDAVRKVIAPLRDALSDAGGKLKTDPLSGWGMIDNIRNKIDNAGLETSVERHVVSQLMEMKRALTEAMDQSTNGRFGEYLGKQNELLQQRNAMDVLQKFRPQLTNSKGDIQFAAFHKWMLGLARQRGAPGADAAMSIPDSTMKKLIGIDKDLKRAQNIDLGKGRGSPTNLLFSLSKSMGLGLVHAAVHGGVAAMGGGGVGNLLAQSALSTGATKIHALNLKRHVRRSLAPPPAGENWLEGP